MLLQKGLRKNHINQLPQKGGLSLFIQQKPHLRNGAVNLPARKRPKRIKMLCKRRRLTCLNCLCKEVGRCSNALCGRTLLCLLFSLNILYASSLAHFLQGNVWILEGTLLIFYGTGSCRCQRIAGGFGTLALFVSNIFKSCCISLENYNRKNYFI